MRTRLRCAQTWPSCTIVRLRQGHDADAWRVFLFTVFSRCASISGADIRLMLELWTHAYEAFQEVSFFFLMCVSDFEPFCAHSRHPRRWLQVRRRRRGKSMRATRMKEILIEGWMRKAGESSKEEGMNGIWDEFYGYFISYDEMPAGLWRYRLVAHGY